MPTAFTDTTLRFGLHQERRDAPTPPCKCHADLFAPACPLDAGSKVEPVCVEVNKSELVEPAVFPYWITC